MAMAVFWLLIAALQLLPSVAPSLSISFSLLLFAIFPALAKLLLSVNSIEPALAW